MAHRQTKKIIELGVDLSHTDNATLLRAVAALAQENARSRLATAALAALTDNTGGTPSAATPKTLPAGTLPVATTAAPAVMMAPKAGFDTAVAAIGAGQFEIQERLKAIATATGVTRTIAGITGAADGILAVVTTALAGVADTTCVDATTGLTRLRGLRDNNAKLVAVANACLIALGMPTISDETGGSAIPGTAAFTAALQAASGDAVTTGAASLPEVATETYLGVLVNHLATLAAACNSMGAVTAVSGGPLVVATSRARTKFIAGDVTF